MKRLLLLVVGASMATLLLGGCGTGLRPAAATVNGSTISQKSFEAELAAVEGNVEYLTGLEQAQGTQGGATIRGSGPGTLSSSFVGNLLTFNILLELVNQELDRRGLAITAADLTGAREEVFNDVGGEPVFAKFPADYQNTLLRRSAVLAKFRGALSPTAVDDAAVQTFYDENADEFTSICVSHILFAAETDGQLDQDATAGQLVPLRAAADEVKAQLDGGGDFGALAAQHTKDAGSRGKAGSLGCGPPDRFEGVDALDTAIAGLAVNEVSQPVQTSFGWHLIKVDSREVRPLADVSGEIRQRLQSGDQEGVGRFISEAIEKAKVSVNPRYGTFQKTGDNVGVVPPAAPTTTEPGAPPDPPGGLQQQP